MSRVVETSRSSTGDDSTPGDRRRIVRTHDVEGGGSLSTSVAVALATGTDALELDQPLSDVIDPDALDALFRPLVDDGAGTATVSFQYQDSAVTVRSDGLIVVERA